MTESAFQPNSYTPQPPGVQHNNEPSPVASAFYLGEDYIIYPVKFIKDCKITATGGAVVSARPCDELLSCPA